MTSSQDYNSQSTSWIDKQGHEEGTDTNLNRCHLDAASAQLAFCHQSLLPPADKQSFTFNSQVVQRSVCPLLQTLQSIHQPINHPTSQVRQSLTFQPINSPCIQSHICLFIPAFADPFLPSFVSSVIHSFVHSIIRPFVHSFIQRRHLHLWHLPCQCTPFG